MLMLGNNDGYTAAQLAFEQDKDECYKLICQSQAIDKVANAALKAAERQTDRDLQRLQQQLDRAPVVAATTPVSDASAPSVSISAATDAPELDTEQQKK